MSNPENMVASVAAYIELFNAQDAAGIANLFADDATVEDPVGTPLKEGKQAILEFYTLAVKNGAVLKQEGQTRIVGNNAAFAFTVSVGAMTSVDKAVNVELPPGGMVIHVIDIFTFNDADKVTSMRAFWGPTNIVQT